MLGTWRVALLGLILALGAIVTAWPDQTPVAAAHPADPRPVVLVPGSTRSPIKHIVFVAKENRSFDHYFGAMPDPSNSLDQARTARCARAGGGYDTFTMPAAPDPMPQDVSHSNSTWNVAYQGGAMDGFCLERGAVTTSGQDLADTQMQAGQISNYWAYANTYGISDEMFSSFHGASFANNVFAVAAQTGRFDTTLGRRAILGNPIGGDAGNGAKTSGCDSSAGTVVR